MIDRDVDDYFYSNLSNAIILQAMNDYKRALSMCRSCDELTPQAIKLEKFFRSQWYYELTDVDGELIINKIRKEVFG